MSFLDKLKEKAAAQRAEKKESPVDDMMEGAEDENKKVASILSRLKGKTEKEETVEEETLQEKADAVVEKVMKKKAEKETTPATEIAEPEVQKESSKEDINEEPAEPPKEEVKTKKRGRKKKTEEENKEKPEVHTEQYEQNYDVLGRKFDYDEMTGIVLDFFGEDEWNNIEEELTKKMNEIRIEPDMNPGTLKYALAALNNLYDEVATLYDNQQKLLVSLADKDLGAAVAYKKIYSVGSNAEERERNGMIALTRANVDGKTVNYIAMIAAVRIRNVFLSNFIRRIQYKSNLCITMSGAIKMEQNLITMSA